MDNWRDWILTAMTALPAVAGAGLAVLRSERAAKIGALVVAFIVLGLAGVAYATFDRAGDEYQFTLSLEWIANFKIRYAMGVDGLALAMIALTALITPLCMVASWESIHDRAKGFFIALLLLEAGMIGVFCAMDLFLFYVFWEAMLIPMVLIIGIWGGPRRVYAAVKFFLYTMVGSLLMFIAILVCYLSSDDDPVKRTLSIVELQQRLPGIFDLKMQLWLFSAFGLAFAVKVPLFPFHTWLPDAHVEAPTAGSVILAGVLLKMGTYGFLRFAVPLFPGAAQHLKGAVIALSLISIVYGALMSMTQSDIKKLIAYSSVSHLGYCMLGIFAFNVTGVQGGILQMVNHGVSTGALFMLVGMIYDRTHRRGVDDFGGVAKAMPVYATIFLVVTLSSIGLPGLNGFVGEFLVIAGAFAANRAWAAIAALGVILGAIYMLKLYRDVFFGPLMSAHKEKLIDLSKRELAALAPLIVLIVLVGVRPAVVLDVTQKSAEKFVQSAGKPAGVQGGR